MSCFSLRLKELRKGMKISQQSLADAIGTSKSSINMYERGEREPGLEMVSSFADFFDVKADYILGLSDDKRSPKEAKKFNKLILESLEAHMNKQDLTKKEMEEFLDWYNLFDDLENGRILGDEGLLKTIDGMLSIDLSNIDVSIDKQIQLTEGERLWLEVYRRTSEDTRTIFINMMKQFDSLPEDRQALALSVIRAALGEKR